MAQAGLPEDLVAVDVADAGDEPLVHQQRLQLRRCAARSARANDVHEIGSSTGSKPRSASSGTSSASSSGATTNTSPKVPRVDEAELAALGEGDDDVRCPSATVRPWARPAAAGRSSPGRRPAARRCRGCRQVLARAGRRRLDLGALEPGLRTAFFGRCAGDRSAPVTSTVLIRLPTTSARARAGCVSTSGSSGIGRSPLGSSRRSRVGQRASQRARGRRPARPASSTGPRPRPRASPPTRDGGEELLGVVGPVVGDLVAGRLVEAAGRQLLEPALVVLAARARAAPRRCGRRAGRSTSCVARLQPAVEVDGADDRLEGVGQDRRLLPAARAAPRPCRAAVRRRARARRPPRRASTALTTVPGPWPARPRRASGYGAVDVVGDDQRRARRRRGTRAARSTSCPGCSAHHDRWHERGRQQRRVGDGRRRGARPAAASRVTGSGDGQRPQSRPTT